MTTTTEQLEANKKLARDYIDQVFNQHNPSKAADFVTGDVVWHGNSLGDIAGAENLAGLLGSFIGALPDPYAAVQDLTGQTDVVMGPFGASPAARGGCQRGLRPGRGRPSLPWPPPASPAVDDEGDGGARVGGGTPVVDA